MSRYFIARCVGVLLLTLVLFSTAAHAQCGTTPAEILLTTGRRSLSVDVLPSPDGSMYVVLASVDKDSLGNGMWTGTGGVLLKYGAGNRLEWAKHAWFSDTLPRYGGFRSGDHFRYAIDSAGGVLVSSSGSGRLIGHDTVHRWRRFAVVRLRPDGQISGIDSLSEARTSNYPPAVVEFAALDNGFIAATQDHRCRVWRINPGGAYTCVTEPNLSDFQFHSVASDGHGGVLVAGEFIQWYLDGDTLRTPGLFPGYPPTQPAYFVARWTLDGRLDWYFLRVIPDPFWKSHEFQTLATRNGIGAVLSFDDTTSLIVRGSDTLGTGPLTVAVFGLDGAFRWVRSFDYKSRPGMRADNYSYPDEVEFDLEIGAGGYVYASVPGRWARNGRFPLNETDTLLVTTEDQILLVFDSTGGLACARVLPNAAGAGLGADRSGRVFLTGLMGEFTVLNGDTLRNPSWPRYSLFLTELVPPSSGVAEAISAGELRAVPNPARGRVEITLPAHIEGRCRVVIMGVAGERVREETHDVRQTGRILLDVSALASGVYSVTIEAGRETFRSRVVVVR